MTRSLIVPALSLILLFDIPVQSQAQVAQLGVRQVLIEMGSAFPTLVSRYAVSWTDGSSQSKAEVFDARGGVLTDQLRPVNGQFPNAVGISFTVDFTPESGYPPIKMNLTQSLENSAVTFAFKPYIHQVAFFFVFPRCPRDSDYLLLQWTQVVQGRSVVMSRRISADDLRKSSLPIVVPLLANNLEPQTIDVTVSGDFRGKVIRKFSGSFGEATSAVILRGQEVHGEYVLVSQ